MSEHARVQVVPRELLEELAAETLDPAPDPTPTESAGPSRNGTYTSRLLVERWLQERGVSFRVKGQPDGKGRTVYVLQQCPFDPAHGDPDACIMQAPDGKLSAQCFHNSCRGRGWQDFKEALGPPQRHHYDPPLPRRKPPKRARPKPLPSAESGPESSEVDDLPDGYIPVAASVPGPDQARLPRIQGNKRQLRDVTADALAALRARNDPPTLFQRAGMLTRLRIREDSGAPFLEPLEDAALRGVLARVADWFRFRDTKEGPVEEEAAPPTEVVKDLATLPAWEGVPGIDAVVECPVFARTGELVQTPGFHPVARLWYQPGPGLDIPQIPPEPTAAEIAGARDLLLVDLLGDFPFEDEASQAHALAALLLPFVRPLIDGPTPLHLLDAPTEGTGKTLLAAAVALVATGRDAEAIAEGSSDEEWRKRITAVLVEGPTFVLLDNLSRTLDAGALASALTTRIWKDRILGFSKTAALPNRCVWLASGNNTRLSRELIRRTLWCRLDAKVDAPWERKDFRHPNLLGWAKAHRGRLVAAALTLCQAWVARGWPAGTQTLGMFESWAEVVGGILDVAGVPGLLANARAFRAARADQAGEWRAFVVSWWQRYGDQEVGVQELFRFVTEQRLLDSVLGDKGERSQRTKLGLALVKAAGRVVGDYRLEGGSEDHSGRQQYRLCRIEVDPPSAPEGVSQWEA